MSARRACALLLLSACAQGRLPVSPAAAAEPPLAEEQAPHATVPGPLPLVSVPVELLSLEASIEAFRERFNQDERRMRLVAVLSPHCPLCITGIQAVLDEVLRARPQAEISVEAVWSKLDEADDAQTALEAAHFAPVPRVRHYWDPHNRLAAALGRSLSAGREELAWDVYLFYEPGARWEETPPEPTAWTTQRTNIDPAHLPADLDLRLELRRLMEALAAHIPE